jgi:hypothetical protein
MSTLAAMARVLFDDIVFTDYGQFDIVWSEGFGFDGDWDRSFAGQANGFVGAAHGTGIYVNLARRSGGSRVQIVVTESEPDTALDHFEDVVEVSVVVPSDVEVRWESWAAESGGTLGTIDGGVYRVRVSAHGRDAGQAGEFDDGVVDEYLIEFWKSPSRDDEVVRCGSSDGAYWHREIGGRR